MGHLIPVRIALEPNGFDESVRRPGLLWLKENGFPVRATDLPPFWRRSLQDLWQAYNGICAYYCIYFHRAVGAHTTDHYVAKSDSPNLAYEWKNYRLSCLGANRKKGRFDDILDPFDLEEDTFLLNLDTGRISPNPSKTSHVQNLAQQTINRLGLDDAETRGMRASCFEEFLRENVSADYLRRHSPFVWHEARRQGLL